VAELAGEDVAGRRLLVVGGGDAAFDYALNLHRKGAHVTVAFRNESPRCLPLLWERAGETDGLEIRSGTRVASMRETGGLVRVGMETAEGESTGEFDMVVIAAGREPNLKIIPGYTPSASVPLDMEPEGFPGLYLAGDVRWGRYRQASIATADGILAAMKIQERCGMD
jgi:thioredoxin reductase